MTLLYTYIIFHIIILLSYSMYYILYIIVLYSFPCIITNIIRSITFFFIVLYSIYIIFPFPLLYHVFPLCFNLHFGAFGAEKILKIAINAKERERWQPLAQITRKFDLFGFIESTLI